MYLCVSGTVVASMALTQEVVDSKTIILSTFKKVLKIFYH